MQPLITVYTQAYNTKPYIRQSIESVLNQTYQNIQYILVDNGCTDGTSDELKEYAKRDSRIELIQLGKNQKGIFSWIPKMYGRGEYFTSIDSDDWWDRDYLIRLLAFLQNNHLDFAITGTKLYRELDGSESILRKVDVPVCMTLSDFANMYPRYWVYPSTHWASLYPMKYINETNIAEILDHEYAYGGDTMMMLSVIEHSSRIGIDNSAMYHYRIRKSSVSYEYNPKRFEANLAYCDQIRSFLIRHNAFDTQKGAWLKRVYLSSVGESVRLALGAQNSLQEKLKVCSEIAAHPKTAEAMELPCNERTALLNQLRQLVSATIQHGTEADFRELLPILRCISPKCGPVVTEPLLALCRKEPALQTLLLKDDLTALALELLQLITQGRYTKNFDLPDILARLLPENPLSTVRDKKFYRKYPSLCADVIRGNDLSALDHMTEALMNQQISYGLEAYLQLYLTLAALENQVPAFLFGKVQLAQFYLEQKNRAACEKILQELDEMGMEEQEEVVQIKALLKEMEPEL